MAQEFQQILYNHGEIMSVKQKYFFEDGISYSDNTTFVDYPQIKIRSYDKPEGSLFKTILIYIYLLLIISGLFYLLF